MHMPLFVGLDGLPIECCSRIVAGSLTKLDELFVFLQCKRLTRELSSPDPFHCRLEAGQQLEHGSVAAGSGIEVTKTDPHSLQMLFDEPVMLGLVAYLPRECKFHLDFRRGRYPYGGDLTRFQFILEGHFQTA